MGEKRAGGPASSSPAEKYSGCKSRYRLRRFLTLTAFCALDASLTENPESLGKCGIFGVFQSVEVERRRKLGTRSSAAKVAFFSAITFFSLKIILICVCSERVSRGSDFKHIFIIHWMSTAIRGKRTQFQVANKLADALSWLIIFISRTASAENHVSPGHVAAH
jgi:hypothetical protein